MEEFKGASALDAGLLSGARRSSTMRFPATAR